MSVQPTAQTDSSPTASAPVVCVDLDGTLIASDLLWEPYIALFKRAPVTALRTIAALTRGRAEFKRRVASSIDIDASTLPYRSAVLDYLGQLHQQGAHLVLATASDERYARAVADHLGLFDELHASDGQTNLSGRHKAAKLVARFGPGGFSYVGNDWSDVPVWQAATDSTAVAPTAGLARHLASRQLVSRTVGSNRQVVRGLFRGIRSYQWVKNLLVFVPLLASHRVDDFRLWFMSVLAFVAFSLCASAIYLANDILDIESDRRHPRKRFRPFAAGDVSIPAGVGLSVVLLAAAFAVSVVGLSWKSAGVLLIYLVLTTSYSMALKSKPVVDVFLLTALYVLRVVAGGVATGIAPSSWLLAFALFFFLSLAFVKRFTELTAVDGWLPGRGYGQLDAAWMHSIGTSAGFMAVLVLALYVNSPEVGALYSRPQFLWLLCPILLFWFTRLWFRAGRGQLHDDPIVDAMKDPFGYLLVGAAAVMLVAAVR
jgi:4-hydroxybenzoate polyprenyltransferase/phosphoserine phosphatase